MKKHGKLEKYPAERIAEIKQFKKKLFGLVCLILLISIFLTQINVFIAQIQTFFYFVGNFNYISSEN